MPELGDDLRAFLITVWYCKILVEGRIKLIPLLALGSTRVSLFASKFACIDDARLLLLLCDFSFVFFFM